MLQLLPRNHFLNSFFQGYWLMNLTRESSYTIYFSYSCKAMPNHSPLFIQHKISSRKVGAGKEGFQIIDFMFLCLCERKTNQKFSTVKGPIYPVYVIEILQVLCSHYLALQILYFHINLGKPWSRPTNNFFEVQCILDKLTKKI